MGFTSVPTMASFATSMAKQKTFYDTLGVSPTASLQEIKEAYRKRARVAHPDLHRDRNTTMRQLAEEQIRLLNEAYDVLTRGQKRELYDRCLEDGLDFYEVEQYERPESDAEREIREAAERFEQEGLQKSVEDAVAALETLMPGARWRRADPGDEYFSAFLAGQKGPMRYRVWFKALLALGPADVPGLASYAQAVLQTVPPGLIREQHAYLMIGRTVTGASELYEAIEAFNQTCFQNVGGRAPRSFIAFTGVGEGTVKVPGIAAPEPPLSSLQLSLAKHFPL